MYYITYVSQSYFKLNQLLSLDTRTFHRRAEQGSYGDQVIFIRHQINRVHRLEKVILRR